MLFALMVTTLAGLSTGLGGLVVLFCRRPGARMMAFSLGFAAGVMITVSLTDMLPHTVAAYAASMPRVAGALCSASLCLLGMVIAFLLGRCVPDEAESLTHTAHDSAIRHTALRSAMITTAAIVLHNLPEGILTLFTGYANPKLGVTLALAIALHNIPEGIAIAVPVYYATNSRVRGVLYALFSGLAEPAGALLAFAFFARLITPLFLNGLIAGIAGIMLFVSFSELIGEGFSYGKNGFATAGLVLGTLVMDVGIYLV
ncbi:MAG: ZIP family metal transporter [Ruthenibacterium sp.]